MFHNFLFKKVGAKLRIKSETTSPHTTLYGVRFVCFIGSEGVCKANPAIHAIRCW